MKIDEATFQHLAKLSKLQFSKEEQAIIQKDLERITDFFGLISAVDTTAVEPLIYLSEQENVSRADEARNTLAREDALRNAPKHDGEHFLVPKMIDK